MKWIVVTFATGLTFAQPVPLRVSLTHQPVEAFVAAFGSKLKGVGLYSVRACAGTGVSVSGGRLLQVAESAGLSPVDNALVTQLAAKSRRGSKLYRISRAVEWGAFIMGFLTAGGAVAARESIRVIFPLVGLTADRLSSELSKREYGAVTGELLDAERSYHIASGGCAGGLFFGAYRAAFNPVIVEMVIQ